MFLLLVVRQLDRAGRHTWIQDSTKRAGSIGPGKIGAFSLALSLSAAPGRAGAL